jgi:hypothetical protein
MADIKSESSRVTERRPAGSSRSAVVPKKKRHPPAAKPTIRHRKQPRAYELRQGDEEMLASIMRTFGCSRAHARSILAIERRESTGCVKAVD